VFLSNHYHLLVEPDSEEQLAVFMRFLNTNLSKQVGRIQGWSGPVFQRRYQAIPVSEEEQAQVARLRYLLEHGAKEDLVERPEDWPGVHCVQELTRGESEIWGVWHERTKIWKAVRAGKKLSARERITREKCELSPLPAWRSRSRQERRTLVRELTRDIEAQTRARRQESGRRVLGERRVRAQDPLDRPRRSERSPAPFAHAASVETWLAMKIAYRTFAKVYREAAALLRSGRTAEFPGGCFPPGRPFLARAGPVAA
jgi:hypothetical protein